MAKKEGAEDDNRQEELERVAAGGAEDGDGEGGSDGETGKRPGENEDGEGGDARLVAGSGGEDEGDNSAEEERELSPEQIEAKREARRQRKQRQRERRIAEREELEILRGEVADLRGRVQLTEKRSVQTDLATIDDKIAHAKSERARADKLKREILASGDPERLAGLADVDEFIYTARRTEERLTEYKTTVERNARQAPATDPTIPAMARKWAAKYQDFDPNGGDEDSQLVQLLDTQVAAAGFDPRTQAYWNELDKRIKKRLPHWAEAAAGDGDGEGEDDGEERPARRQNTGARRPGGPPMGGSGRGANGGGAQPGDFKLSRVRREALEEAGYEPGTKDWNRMINVYKKQDADARRSAGGDR